MENDDGGKRIEEFLCCLYQSAPLSRNIVTVDGLDIPSYNTLTPSMLATLAPISVLASFPASACNLQSTLLALYTLSAPGWLFKGLPAQDRKFFRRSGAVPSEGEHYPNINDRYSDRLRQRIASGLSG